VFYLKIHCMCIFCYLFLYFLNQLELILNKVHKTSNDLILCDDLNINYFNDNFRKDLLNRLIVSFNLVSTINFPTRSFNNSCIQTIFILISIDTNSLCTLLLTVSDHYAQVITFIIFLFLFPNIYLYFLTQETLIIIP
jgi:hypothetical protein